MNVIFRYLFKTHDWFYKGDGPRICMVCGRVESPQSMKVRRQDPSVKYWKCIKRGNEAASPCGESYYDDFGQPDRGPKEE